MQGKGILEAWMMNELSDDQLCELRDETVAEWMQCMKRLKRHMGAKLDALEREMEKRGQWR